MQQRLYWLDYDPVAFAVLVIGMGIIELLALAYLRGRFPNYAGKPDFRTRAKAPTSRICIFEPPAQRKKARVFIAFALRLDGRSGELFELAGFLEYCSNRAF